MNWFYITMNTSNEQRETNPDVESPSVKSEKTEANFSHPLVGSRGEVYVIIQFILLLLFVIMPPWPGSWWTSISFLTAIPAGVMFALSAYAGFSGLLALGANLTPFPRPKENATLVQSGIYALIRHPLYLCLLLFACGWAIFFSSLLHLFGLIILFFFFNRKADFEEAFLSDTFTDYADYRKQSYKLLPFVY